MSKSQRLTWILAIGLIGIGSLAISQQFGFGAGYALDATPMSQPRDRPLVLEAGARKLPPWPEFGSDLIARPLFNEERKPTPAGAKVDGPGKDVPLEATLTGVIITDKVRLAMLLVKDPTGDKSVRVKLGQAMTGEQSEWRLVELQPRMAAFEAAGQPRLELRLQVNDKGLTGAGPPPMPVAAAPAQPPPAPGAAPAQAAKPGADEFERNLANRDPSVTTRSDEVRKRIEERRRQLREEAQRMSQQNNNQPPQ